MPSVCISYHLPVSLLQSLLANTENSILKLIMQLYSFVHNKKNAVIILHRQDNNMAMIWWLGYINCNSITYCISLIANSETIVLNCIVC